LPLALLPHDLGTLGFLDGAWVLCERLSRPLGITVLV
jgi:hypothetical protein